MQNLTGESYPKFEIFCVLKIRNNIYSWYKRIPGPKIFFLRLVEDDLSTRWYQWEKGAIEQKWKIHKATTFSSKLKLMHEYGHWKGNLMENMTKGLIYPRKHLIFSKHYRKKGVSAHWIVIWLDVELSQNNYPFGERVPN